MKYLMSLILSLVICSVSFADTFNLLAIAETKPRAISQPVDVYVDIPVKYSDLKNKTFRVSDSNSKGVDLILAETLDGNARMYISDIYHFKLPVKLYFSEHTYVIDTVIDDSRLISLMSANTIFIGKQKFGKDEISDKLEASKYFKVISTEEDSAKIKWKSNPSQDGVIWLIKYFEVVVAEDQRTRNNLPDDIKILGIINPPIRSLFQTLGVYVDLPIKQQDLERGFRIDDRNGNKVNTELSVTVQNVDDKSRLLINDVADKLPLSIYFENNKYTVRTIVHEHQLELLLAAKTIFISRPTISSRQLRLNGGSDTQDLINSTSFFKIIVEEEDRTQIQWKAAPSNEGVEWLLTYFARVVPDGLRTR